MCQLASVISLGFPNQSIHSPLEEDTRTSPRLFDEVAWVVVAEEHPLVDCCDFLFHITEDELE